MPVTNCHTSLSHKLYQNMELHQFRYFEATARLGSMMAAAAECHVSQPALSVQIQKLEKEAGTRLFVREARGVRLTQAGERTLAAARRILQETTGWGDDMRSGEFTGAPVVRLAAQPFISATRLPSVLADMLRAETGRPRLRFHERAPAVIPSVLRSGEADVALLDLNATGTRGLATRPLLEIPYALFIPPGHPLGESDAPASLAELAKAPLLLYSLAPGLEERLFTHGRESGPVRDPIFSGEHAPALFELVAAGAGLAILPALCARRIDHLDVRTRPLADYDACVTVGLAWLAEEKPPGAATALGDRLRTAHPEWVSR